MSDAIIDIPGIRLQMSLENMRGMVYQHLTARRDEIDAVLKQAIEEHLAGFEFRRQLAAAVAEASRKLATEIASEVILHGPAREAVREFVSGAIVSAFGGEKRRGK